MSPKKEKGKEPAAAADQPSDTSELTELSASSTAADAPVAASTGAKLTEPQSLDTLTKLVSTLLEKVGDMETHIRKDSPRASAPEPAASLSQSQSREEITVESPSSTPLRRSATLPPHMTLGSTTAGTTHPSRQRFRALTTKKKQMFRDVCSQLGTSIWDIIEGITADDLAGTVGPDESKHTLDAVDDAGDDEDAADAAESSRETKVLDTSDSFQTAIRWCKPELVDEYHGDPLVLEEWLTGVHDLIRSYEDVPQWERAVLRAAASRLKGNAKKWHNSLKTDEVRAIKTFSDLEIAMRKQFRPNRAEQRRVARERAWKPTEEAAIAYYFDKVLLLRTAFGEEQPEVALVHDIVDCLPASFRATLRMPRDDATLDDLRSELVEREALWRELNPAFKIVKPHMALSPSVVASTASPMRRSSSEPPRPIATSSVATVATAPGTSPPQSRPPSLAATYDPARVIPEGDGRPRRYRRPADDQVISLNRPCARCGEKHFTFEHEHLQAALHTAAPDEDEYPVISDEDGADF
ncbi:hypothetical protein OC834_007288 [Tilletia horrida]|nr:hypothetical protein OC834_007288 [Tilletia horrida]KAK0546183.1 hypothetical protein OC844_007277 [Tilletia horrida]